MATVEKIRKDIEKTKEKIAEQQKRLRSLARHRPGGKFCVSVFRPNQEYHIINVHDWGLFPLVTAFPGGWDGMRAGTA